MKTHSPQPSSGRNAQAGFTLVESLVAIVVLIFGLMAVTNLMLVAASSNTVANQGTAAVTAGTQVLDFLKSTTFNTLDDNGALGTAFDAADGGKDCNDTTLLVSEAHCTTTTPGVGSVHVHWYITAMTDARLLHIRVRAEGMGALTAARSRAEFTTFRACTNSDPVTGGCPAAP